MLAIPDRTVHVTKLADWLEFVTIQSPSGKMSFSTLVSAADLSAEEQSEDISDDEIWEDELVLSVQNEINARRNCIGADYPFMIDARGHVLQLADPITPIGSVYLFCLFLSHVTDRTIVPKAMIPNVDNDVRDLFQACATIAAAGYVQGVAVSFGWPRPDDATFLAALQRTYAMFGDGLLMQSRALPLPIELRTTGLMSLHGSLLLTACRGPLIATFPARALRST